MIKDDDNVLEMAEKHFKDMEVHLKSGGKPVTSTDISDLGHLVVDGIKLGIESNENRVKFLEGIRDNIEKTNKERYR